MEKRFLTPDEVAVLFGLDADRIESLVDAGKLKPLPAMGTFRYDREQLEALEASGDIPKATVSDSSESDVFAFRTEKQDESRDEHQIGDLPEFGTTNEPVSYLELDEEALAEHADRAQPVGGSSSDVAVVDDDDFLNLFSNDSPPASKSVVPKDPSPFKPTVIDQSTDDLLGDLGLSGESGILPPNAAAPLHDPAEHADDELSPGVIAELSGAEPEDFGITEQSPPASQESGVDLTHLHSDAEKPQITDAADSGISLFQDLEDNDEDGIRLETDEEAATFGDSGISLDFDHSNSGDQGDSGISLESSRVSGAGESGISLDDGGIFDDAPASFPSAGESGISLDLDSGTESGIVVTEHDSGLSLDIGDSGLSLESADSGLSLETADSGLSLESPDSGISFDQPPSKLSSHSGVAVFGGGETHGDDDDFALSDDMIIAAEGSQIASASRPRMGDDQTQMLILGEDDELDEQAATFVKGSRKTLDETDALASESVDELEITDDLEEDDSAFDSGMSGVALDDDEEFVDDADAEADDSVFSAHDMATTKAKKKGPALRSFGLPATIGLCVGGAILVLNGWLAWEATSTMWTGAQPSGPVAGIVDSLAGLIPN